MQLMREVYKLGEFAAWEAMLPFTKQRLRDAKGSFSRNDRRAFWWVIARTLGGTKVLLKYRKNVLLRCMVREQRYYILTGDIR